MSPGTKQIRDSDSPCKVHTDAMGTRQGRVCSSHSGVLFYFKGTTSSSHMALELILEK